MQPLTPQLFSLLSSLVEERSGLHYKPSEMSLFADKLSTRLDEAGFESALDYYYYLRYDPGGETEITHLLETLVVGETYLFREVDALTACIKVVIEPAIAARGRARVWSAGCSTGEEPYTLAMMLAKENLLSKVEIVAMDLSERSLVRARRGIIGARSLRALNAAAAAPLWIHPVAARWLSPLEGGAGRGGEQSRTMQVASQITSAIDFRRGSILEPNKGPLFEDFDLILCRNVLIYFAEDVVRLAVAGLSERLRSSGFLVVGTSESLLRFGTLLRCEEHRGTFFYTKGETKRDAVRA